MTKKSAKRVEIPAIIKSELASLTNDELEAVAKLSASLLGGKFVPKEKIIRAETGGQHARAESFYNELASQLFNKTKARARPLQILLSSQDKTAKLFLAKHKEFDQFLEDATGKHELTDGERLKFYTIGANLIASALVEGGFTFNMNTVIGWISNAPSLFNAQFPSYISAGVLHVVIAAYLQNGVKGHTGALVELKAEEHKSNGKSKLREALRERTKKRRAADKIAEYGGH